MFCKNPSFTISGISPIRERDTDKVTKRARVRLLGWAVKLLSRATMNGRSMSQHFAASSKVPPDLVETNLADNRHLVDKLSKWTCRRKTGRLLRRSFTVSAKFLFSKCQSMKFLSAKWFSAK
jgi:hypothetical protein